MNKISLLIIICTLLSTKIQAQDDVLSDLEEVNTYESLKKSEKLPDVSNAEKASPDKAVTEKEKPEIKSAPSKKTEGEDVKMSALEEQDDLQTLKEDIGETVFKNSDQEKKVATKENKNKGEPTNEAEIEDEAKILVNMTKKVKGRLNTKDWSEIVSNSKIEKYSVKEGDTLSSISKTIFGTEDYAAKIWSLNPQITNPNNLEAGMVLAFDTGDPNVLPNVKLGEFSDDEVASNKKGSTYRGSLEAYLPPWIKERKKLIEQGVYFQFASEETYEDLERLEHMQKNNEWEKYDPPISDMQVREPGEEYDSSGFDKTAKIEFNYREGFFLNSFVSTNVIQDVGEIYAAKNESIFMHKYDTIYVSFDKGAKVKPGDLFSIYSSGGEIKHPISDRAGFLFTTTGQIKTVKKIDDVWECYLFDQSGIIQRKDRVTVFTPKIGKIARTYGKRNVEAAIIGSYRDTITGIAFGDVVYLDRGRADGVELGNIFEVYSFVDRGTDKKITASPTYKIGELVVINITDNFSTALVTRSSNEMKLGNIALIKTQEEALKEIRLKKKEKIKDVKLLESKALDELDVELNLDDVSQDILNKADKIQLTEDEIEELDRQERDKSVIKESQRDVKELDRLESEILDAEKSLNETKVDEDKYLEQQNLEEHERKTKLPDPNAFESINEIEKDIGKKYLDEDINNKENPYGLTEFDLEEIDELLNTGHKTK